MEYSLKRCTIFAFLCPTTACGLKARVMVALLSCVFKILESLTKSKLVSLAWLALSTHTTSMVNAGLTVHTRVLAAPPRIWTKLKIAPTGSGSVVGSRL